MTYKKAWVILFIIFAALPTHKIYAQTSNLEKIVGKNTPSGITNFIGSAVNTIEKFRSDMGTVCDNKKTEYQSQINSINNIKVSSHSISEVSKFLKSFKYIELFFFTFLSFSFNNRLMFYFSFALIIFLILRFLWHLFVK